MSQSVSTHKFATAQPTLSPTLPFPQVKSTPPFIATAAASTCNILAISSVTASGNQVGNPATNAIDANLSTRWSNLGVGSSITVNFSKERAICNINIAWYRGTERTSNFVVAVSKDGNTFTNVFSGKSSGTTDGFETYDFPDTTGRYVKITVNGNTLNNWASISEIRVLGNLLNTPPPPSPPAVTSTSPISGATGVALSTKIMATFTEPILSSSVSSSTFNVKVSGSSAILGGSYSLASSDGGKSAIFSPSSTLSPSTTYLATLTTGIKDQAGLMLASAKTWSFSTASTSPNPPPPTEDCNLLPISKASEQGGNHSLGPKYAIDGDLSTRWSNNGIGASITLDLGKKKVICNVDISWYKGASRISNFGVSLSTDDKSYSNAFSGKSAGTTEGFERYNIPDINARYVKITVNGNTMNHWASINEVRIFGDPNNPIPNPNPNPNPNPPPGPPPSDSKLNIAVAGDWGCSSQADQTVTNMQQKTPELVLALGDLSYKSSADCWVKTIAPLQAITKIVMGNHDEDEGNPPSLAQDYLSDFGLGTSYYSFNFHNIHFLMMNSEIPFDTKSPQYSFVDNDLKVASADKGIKWIVVSFHSPMYTSPSKHPPNTPFAEAYHPLFDKYGVDLVLQAHNHNYQRSYPLTFNSGKTTNPTPSTSEKNNYNNPAGEIYVIAGTAGRSLYNLNGKASFNVNQFQGYGFLNLEMSDDGKTMTAKFYSAKDGSIIDQFTISK
jgi:hypothetical protein